MNQSRLAAVAIGTVTLITTVLCWWVGGPLLAVFLAPIVFALTVFATIAIAAATSRSHDRRVPR